MQTLKYTPEGICPNQIVISLEDGIVTAVQFSKGCEGNLQAVSRLVEGMPVQRVIELLKGIDCRAKGTSCPDQLARALEQMAETNA